MSKLLRAEDVAEYLGVTRHRIYSLVREGYLPAIRLGARALRFDPQAIDEFLSNHATRPDDDEQPEQAA